jgi:hypothetical protein
MKICGTYCNCFTIQIEQWHEFKDLGEVEDLKLNYYNTTVSDLESKAV